MTTELTKIDNEHIKEIKTTTEENEYSKDFLLEKKANLEARLKWVNDLLKAMV